MHSISSCRRMHWPCHSWEGTGWWRTCSESLNVGGEDTTRDPSRDTQVGSGRKNRKLTSRWRTQLFALHCLHDICSIVANSGRKEHLNAIVARQRGLSSTNGLLFSRVADL